MVLVQESILFQLHDTKERVSVALIAASWTPLLYIPVRSLLPGDTLTVVLCTGHVQDMQVQCWSV